MAKPIHLREGWLKRSRDQSQRNIESRPEPLRPRRNRKAPPEEKPEVRFFLEKRVNAPKKWILKFMDGTEREPSWEEIVLWMAVNNLTTRVQELEADR